MAALVLARAGAKVRVVERLTFPRQKLCGDTVNPGTLALFDRLGVGAAVRVAALPVSGMIVTGPGGAAVAADYPNDLQGAALRRSVLDLMLLDAAAQAGADVVEGIDVRGPMLESGRVTGIRCTAPGGGCDMPAQLVIAADGRSSRLARGLGLVKWARTRRWAFGASFTDVAAMTSRGEMHVRSGGYVGLAALGDGLVNVCVVRELTRDSNGDRVPAADVIRNAIEDDFGLRERFLCARQVSPVVSLGPLGIEAAAAGAAGLLLAGDAAGFIDPMTGDGLRFAVRGGELAALAALGELAAGTPAHESLAATRRREFTGKSRFNRTLRWLTTSPRGIRATAALAACWSRPFEPLIGLAGDCGLARRGYAAG
jgi:flavin-dependent dehydrogenase